MQIFLKLPLVVMENILEFFYEIEKTRSLLPIENIKISSLYKLDTRFEKIF